MLAPARAIAPHAARGDAPLLLRLRLARSGKGTAVALERLLHARQQLLGGDARERAARHQPLQGGAKVRHCDGPGEGGRAMAADVASARRTTY